MNPALIFSGLTFVFDGLTLKEKNDTITKVKNNGGTISYSLGPKVTHLAVSNNFSPTPYQADIIARHSITTVRADFIHESIKQGEILPANEFLVENVLSTDTSDSASPASSTDEIPAPSGVVIVEPSVIEEEPTPAVSSPVVKKKIISGRNKNQKKVIVVQQGPVEQTTDLMDTTSEKPKVLKFTRDDMDSCKLLLSASLPGGKAKKLLGRLKETVELDSPALVDTSGYLVKQVCCGAYHSALISHAGQLMTWGKGGARLGHGGGKVLKPTVVPGMEDCVKLACSSTQTAVLTADRQLNVFDDNLGKVHFSASHCGDIVEIYSGNGLTAIRNTSGAVYFVGNFMKQTYSLESPIAEEISSVSFGAEHCLLLSKDGTIKSFGSNGSGQLGLGDKTERSAAEVIKGLANVRSIIAGERHSAAVTHEGALYVWGASPHGREDMLMPVKHLTSENIEKLEMSKENLIALSSNGQVLSWPLDCFGSRNYSDLNENLVRMENVSNISCGAHFFMMEIYDCAPIAHQFVEHGTPDIIVNLMDILGDEAFGLTNGDKCTLLHTTVYNENSAAVLTALLDARSGWNLDAKNAQGKTPAALFVSHEDLGALEIVAERGAELESALVLISELPYTNEQIVELLLEYSVDRTSFFEKNVIEVSKTIIDKVARAGGLLGFDFAPASDICTYAREGKLYNLAPKYKAKYPSNIGMVRGKDDQLLAHKLATALQCYGTRMFSDTWSHPDFIAGDVASLLALLTKTSVKDKTFLNRLLNAYSSGKHIIPVWVDDEAMDITIEAKKKLKTLFVKSGVRFHFSAAEVESEEHKHRVRNFAKQLLAFNTKSLHAPRQPKVSVDDFSYSEENAPVKSTKSPEFRVYVSTTLHDMIEERELLLTKVFPEIERLCAERGVPFSFVDMNAGLDSDILDNESRLQSGFTLIDQSTCFVGLFGERYGWHSQYGGADQFAKNIELVAQSGHKWVSAFENRSINELEVIHGVLKYVPSDKLGSFAESYDETMQGEIPRDALFYYREQSYIQKIPIKKKPQFVSESYSAKSLLNDMKYRINLAGLPSKGYRQPSDFAQEILNDLKKALDRQFPPTMDPVTAADIEIYRQQRIVQHIKDSSVPVFKTQRSLVHSYINSRARQPFTITGDECSGKTHFLASIAAEYSKYSPEALVMFFTVDTKNSQNDVVKNSIVRQIRSRYGERDGDSKTFTEWLSYAGRQAPVLLLIDEIHRLKSFWSEDELLPRNVKLVVTRSTAEPYTSPFSSLLNIDSSELEIFVSHCFEMNKNVTRVFDEAEVKQRILDLPQVKTLAFTSFLVDEVSRVSLPEEVDEIIAKFKGLGTVVDVLKEILLPKLRKEFSNFEQVLQVVFFAGSSLTEAFKNGISFERYCRLKYLLKVPL